MDQVGFRVVYQIKNIVNLHGMLYSTGILVEQCWRAAQAKWQDQILVAFLFA